MKFSCCKILFRGSLIRRMLFDPISIHKTAEIVACIGFDGIEVSMNEALNEYDSGKTMAKNLNTYGLELSGAYWGGDFHDRSKHKSLIETSQKHFQFLHSAESNHLIIGLPKMLTVFEEQPEKLVRAMADCLNEIGKKAREWGIQIGLHNHYGTMFESSKDIDVMMKATNPEYVGFCPDTAHLAISGCNVINIVESYKDRINYIHLKDATQRETYLDRVYPRNIRWTKRFRELGKGDIDFAAVMRILKRSGYTGWCAYEQDNSRTPIRSATVSKRYIDEFIAPIFK